MNKILFFIFIAAFFFEPLIAISSDSTAAEKDELDSLIVYGEGFAFSIKEPAGWKADTSNAAKIHANILFYGASETFDTAKIIIFVRINNKSDEHIEKDLEWDMEQYKKQYPKVQFSEISVLHPRYKTYPKLFYVQDSFYEYVTYLNPGLGNPLTLSVAMNAQGKEAPKDAFAAYQQIIETISLIRP